MSNDRDPVDVAEEFVAAALVGGEWESRDNYPSDERKNWVERGVGEACERFIETPLDDLESCKIEELLLVARQLRRTVRAINDNALAWHAGEEGKARALNVIAVWTAEALAGRIHPGVEAVTEATL